MKYRRLGKTGIEVSEIALGTWQLGGPWGGGFDEKVAEATLHAAVDNGVNFLDTADVYKDGKSEAYVGKFVRSRSEKIYVATKCGRQLSPHTNDRYTPEVLRGFVETSLKNTGLETLDLIQLHCPPWQVYYRPEIFELFDRLKDEGKIQHLGVSVEKVEEGLKAMTFSNVTTIQVIFNPFRQRPASDLFPRSLSNDVGIIVRVPLASGLLTGKFGKDTTFAKGDHRHFNRDGAGFDKGETFAGIPYEAGLEAVGILKSKLPGGENLAEATLRWILGFEAVSCIIPGASKPEQVMSNAAASGLASLSEKNKSDIKDLYKDHIRKFVHQRW